jgi:Asp-tRNA(Asn)/Glu-tRNA(Gln) amidotransferase A subunit family amidase
MKNSLRIISAIFLSLFIFSFIKSDNPSIYTEDVDHAENVLGLSFTLQERDSMLSGLESQLKDLQNIREYSLSNDVPPAFIFNPIPVDYTTNTNQQLVQWHIPDNVELPVHPDDLAFYTILQLASLIKNQKISSSDLTRYFINRLKRYGDTLKCVITITEDMAIQQAALVDREIRGGHYKGPLHGIPYGIKDLLSVESYRTTWGAAPYKEQVIEQTATVVKKLQESGAVLIAKLTLGALAWGDVWYGGMTRNPWDLDQGSSGSSAGPASATAAGLVPFSIGSETLGSIVSPSNRCGITGLRPSYGRVSRTGAMALSWTMDKLGPMCRSAMDCAIIFDAIHGQDGIDQSLVDAAFNFNMKSETTSMRIGYLKDLFDQDNNNKKNDQNTLALLRASGIRLEPVSLPVDIPINSLTIILEAEAAAAFDDLTRSDRDDLMVRQIVNAWPNVFRQSRFIPAVEYINANRIRYLLIQEFNNILKEYDAIISPTFGGNQLHLTNLTGHPCVVLPNGFDEKGHPTSISIIGNLFEEEKILRVAIKYQEETDYEDMHPPIFQ